MWYLRVHVPDEESFNFSKLSDALTFVIGRRVEGWMVLFVAKV
jgi:hypothetical protein